MVREAITVNSRLSRDIQQDPIKTKKEGGRISNKEGRQEKGMKGEKERNRGRNLKKIKGEEIVRNKFRVAKKETATAIAASGQGKLYS